ncbi:MAG: hypothetical protein KTQ49_02015 [Candidatus Omnitrophica bacterium]|nr:hypothetical protein [Candidatus Omnitrophota bacterium]
MRCRIFFTVLALAVLPLSPCFADWFDGEVERTDLEAGTVTVSEIDPITDTEETYEVLTDDATTFSGVNSLAELKSGDDIAIEAQYDEPTDSWKAVSVEMPEAGE